MRSASPPSGASSFDIVVVGGGIVGAACVREFAEAGMRTALIEAEVIGGGATAAGMGHLAVMDDSEAQFALTRYFAIALETIGRTPSGRYRVSSLRRDVGRCRCW